MGHAETAVMQLVTIRHRCASTARRHSDTDVSIEIDRSKGTQNALRRTTKELHPRTRHIGAYVGGAVGSA